MASTFPGALDNFTDPLSNSPLNSPSHSAQHADLNDAVEKIEAYMGLVKVIPTSISSVSGTSATLGATGTVTIGSANTSVTINGAFSSLYNDYRIIISNSVGSILSDNVVMTLGASATGYYGVLTYATFAGAANLCATDNNSARWTYVANANNAVINGAFDVLSPFQAKFTNIQGAAWTPQNASGFFNGIHQVATSYTSFTLATLGSTMTGGTIRVYGYRN